MMYIVIETLMILHNILQNMGDDPAEIEGWNGAEDSIDDDEAAEFGLVIRARDRAERLTEEQLHTSGLARRKILMEYHPNI